MSTTKVPNFLVSPLPPSASETTASLESLDNNKLSLGGGVVSGAIDRVSNYNQTFHMCGSDQANNGNYDLGWDYTNRDGAFLGLRSSSYTLDTSEKGCFVIGARDDTNYYALVGKTNGALTWSGPTIASTDSTTKLATTAFVQNAIKNITEYTLQLNTSYFINRSDADTYRMRILKVGRICFLVGNMYLTQATTSQISTQICSTNIPSEYLPAYEVDFCFMLNGVTPFRGWYSSSAPKINITLPANLSSNSLIQLGTIIYISAS